MSRLVIVTRPIGGYELREIDSRATAIVLGPDALAAADEMLVDVAASHRAFLFGVARGSIGGRSLAAGMLSDFFVVTDDAVLRLSGTSSVGDVAAALVRRIGRRALRLLVEGGNPGGREAVEAGCADALVPSGVDPLEWAVGWFGSRSLLALQSGARLIRLRGGDVAERAEFARLFSIGEPQEGLGKFLDKVPLDFSDKRIVETI